MKKLLPIILSLLLLLAFSSTALASSANGNDKHGVKKELKAKFAAQLKKEHQGNTKTRFKDTENHWAKGAIDLLSETGLLNGYTDGTFRPNQSITQAESIAILMRLTNDDTDQQIDENNDTNDQSDVPTWAKSYCNKAAQKGIINWNRFHSAVQANRAQTAVWIAKALGLEPVDTSDMPYSDGMLISKEDVGYILALYKAGFMIGSADGKFNPNCCITRAEMAAILERILENGSDKDSISIQKTATLEQGKTLDLDATVNYADDSTKYDLAWTSSNEDLAAVDDNGTVTAADDGTGTVNIKVTATNKADENDTMSATCVVTIIEKTVSATLKRTENAEIHNDKVCEEYELVADDSVIPLDADNVEEMTLTTNDESPVALTPNTDTALWLNVQKESAAYVLTVKNKDGIIYEATLDLEAPDIVNANLIGDEEIDNIKYQKYELEGLDLSSVSKLYQIDPDENVAELTSTSQYLLFNTSNPEGDYIYLILDGDQWYTATIDFKN